VQVDRLRPAVHEEEPTDNRPQSSHGLKEEKTDREGNINKKGNRQRKKEVILVKDRSFPPHVIFAIRVFENLLKIGFGSSSILSVV
jgi:hypothetical protein